MRREYTFLALGALLLVTGLFVTASPGNAIPYAPGDDSATARAAARTSHGYTSQGVTVYEGSAATITLDENQSGNYHLTLASGTPPLYAQRQISSPTPPSVSVGQNVRVWTVTDVDARGDRQNFIVRMEVGSTRWLSGYFSTPTFNEGGSGPAETALALGGVPVGLLVGAAVLAVIVRRQVSKSPARWRLSDHISIWSPAAAVVLFAFWHEYASYADANAALPLIPLIALALIVGLIAGSSGLARRTPGTVLWPSLVGIVPGICLLLVLGVFGLALCSGALMFA